jgi:ABC-type sugar transport system substrate-binding protein
MKKVLSIVLSVMLLVSVFTGCTSKSSQSTESSDATSVKTYKIGFTVNDFNDKWVSYVLDAVKAWDEQNVEVEVVLGNAQSDSSKQMALVEDWISQGFDAICVKPVDLEATKAMANACKAANIPYVAIQQPIDEATARCIQNSVKTGETQMQAVIDKLGGKGNIVILEGEPGTLVATQRLDGNKNILAKYPDVKLEAVEVANWQRDQAMKVTENWIQGGIKFDAVVASCDEMAIGAMLALDAANMRGNVIIAGIDATPDALKLMKEGKLDITLFADANKLGTETLNLALKLVKGEAAEDVVIDDLLVTPEEADKYLELQGE